MTINVLPFDQPAGSFLLAAMPADQIIRISRADPRKFDSITMESTGGIQREPSRVRIKEIAEYANSVDATFPTPILLALDEGSYSLNANALEITGERIADIVDGQHRVLGLEQSHRSADFIIPVVFILDATEEQKALIFATINGKQTKVPASVIYDLFGITKTRSPQKTAHEIARALNSASGSPWYNRLKMLGKKSPGSNETLSQGTFIKFLLDHISSDPAKDMDIMKRGEKPQPRDKCVFNEYWRKEEDSTILKILMNLFHGAKNTWPTEWQNPNISILTKTTGFNGIMRALPEMVNKGKSRGDLSESYFSSIFAAVKNTMDARSIPLTSEHFSASASGEAEFRDLILVEVRRL
jgi:DGQHR domain-containing protein